MKMKGMAILIDRESHLSTSVMCAPFMTSDGLRMVLGLLIYLSADCSRKVVIEKENKNILNLPF